MIGLLILAVIAGYAAGALVTVRLYGTVCPICRRPWEQCGCIVLGPEDPE